MASVSYMFSTLLMGLLVVGVAVALVRLGNRRQRPAAAGGGDGRTDDGTDTLGRYGSAIGRMARNPGTWYVVFFLLVFGFVGGALALVTSPPEIGGAVFLALGLAFAAALCAFLAWGVYQSSRYRGLKSAQAAMVGAWVLGSLLIVAIVVKLVLSAP